MIESDKRDGESDAADGVRVGEARAASGVKTTLSETWSFALITDIHIGCYFSGYGGEGYADGAAGQDYFLTERLRRTAQWINANRENPEYNIKFLVICGDLTDSAEESEFYKAREMLDGLEIPYIPLLGNHDIWPYTHHSNSSAPSGSAVFNKVFEDTFAALAASDVITAWHKDASTVAGTPLNNYAFDVGGIHFLALDCVSREPASFFGSGANGGGVLHAETKRWMTDYLSKWGDVEPVVLLCHHPLSNRLVKPADVDNVEWVLLSRFLGRGTFSDEDCQDIERCLEGRSNVAVALAGHLHSAELLFGHSPTPPFIWNFNALDFEPVGATEVKLTEALVAGSNGPDGENKGTIRIVRVGEGGRLDYRTVVGEENPAESHALNPSFDVDCLHGYFIFVPHRFSRQDAEYQFDFGDGTTSGDFEPFAAGWEDRVNWLDAETHGYHGGLESHLVKLIARVKIDDDRYFLEETTREAKRTW